MKRLWVANMGDDSLWRIDPESGETKRIDIAAINRGLGRSVPAVGPCHLATDGESLFCVNAFDESVTALSAKEGEIVGAKSVAAHPVHVTLSPCGTYLVVCCGDANCLYILDKVTLKPMFSVPVGLYPCCALFTPDGSMLVVANADSRDVMLLDGEDLHLMGIFQVDGAPQCMAFYQKRGEILVSVTGVDYEGSGWMDFISLGEGRKIARMPMGVAPGGIGVLKNEAWVANTGSGRLSVLSLEEPAVVDLVPAGSMPWHVWAEGDTVFVTDLEDETVTAFSAGTRQPLFSLPTGKEPSDLLLL